jgi:UDP-N-acetylmuramate--alanine ligase
VLSTVDCLVLAEVYPAGEAPIVAADSRSLTRSLRLGGRLEPVFVEAVTDLPGEILRVVRAGDVVITMGAGSVGRVPVLLKEAADA